MQTQRTLGCSLGGHLPPLCYQSNSSDHTRERRSVFCVSLPCSGKPIILDLADRFKRKANYFSLFMFSVRHSCDNLYALNVKAPIIAVEGSVRSASQVKVKRRKKPSGPSFPLQLAHKIWIEPIRLRHTPSLRANRRGSTNLLRPYGQNIRVSA